MALAVDQALTVRVLNATDRAAIVQRVPHDAAIAAEVADWHEQRLREEGRLH